MRLKIFLTGLGDGFGFDPEVRQEGCVMMSTREQRLLPFLPFPDGEGLSPRTAIDSRPKCMPLVACESRSERERERDREDRVRKKVEGQFQRNKGIRCSSERKRRRVNVWRANSGEHEERTKAHQSAAEEEAHQTRVPRCKTDTTKWQQ